MKSQLIAFTRLWLSHLSRLPITFILSMVATMVDTDVTAVCGPKGRHDPARTATRHGHEAGSVSLGGRRVAVPRPRMRASDGSGELAVPTYDLLRQTEMLGRMAMERMLAG